jgi:3-dehydroquinate dehydratase-2
VSVVTRNRVEVMHGVNLDMLGRRDHDIYGDFSLPELEVRVKSFARDLDLEAAFFQSNSEGEFVEHLHRLPEIADAAVVNAGAWTHYSWAIRDALELTGIPTVEVHISDISKREEWRRHSVFEGMELIVGQVYGKGPDGYKDALELIAERLGVS